MAAGDVKHCGFCRQIRRRRDSNIPRISFTLAVWIIWGMLKRTAESDRRLRHISSGYWVVVREFTHKSTVRDIRILSNVTTDLGRSRAWLYVALNEQLLESYLRCFLANSKLVSRYYVKEALVLDKQRMEILLMLSAGLEFVRFQLEMDMAYLDLSSHLRVREARPAEDEEDKDSIDRLSLCSMESSMSQTSSFASDSHSGMTDSVDSTENTTEIIAPTNRFSHINTMTSLDLNPQSDDLEVIRVKRKNHKKGKSKGNRKSHTESDASSISSTTPSPLSPESEVFPESHKMSPHKEKKTIVNHEKLRNCDKDIVNQDPVAKHRLLDIEQSILTDCSYTECKCDQSFELNDGRCTQCNNLRTVAMVTEEVQNGPLAGSDGPMSEMVVSTDERISPCEAALDVPMALPRPTTPQQSPKPETQQPTSEENSIYDSLGMSKMKAPVQRMDETLPIDMTNNLTDITNMQERRPLEYVKNSLNDPAVIVDTCDKALKINSHREHNLQSATTENKVDKDSSKIHSKDINKECGVVNNITSVDRLIYTYDVDLKKPKEACADIKNNLVKESSQPVRDACAMVRDESPETVLVEERKERSESEDSANGRSAEHHHEHEREALARSRRTPQECEHHAEVRVDNNLLLLLMLHIFEEEEEQIIKMFRTCLGHTDGDIQPMYILITTCSIYLLTSSTAECRFNKEISLQYRELDYIAVGFHHQLLHIVCTNRLKQYFLTTGDEQLTKIIIREIDEAIQASEHSMPRLTVLTDATAQKLAMRKWAAKEARVSVDKVKLLCYSMVHWEDKQADNGKLASFGVKKEGVLLHKSHNFLLDLDMLSTWKPSYFILRDGLLMQYAEKSAKSTPKNIVQLVGGDCVGCRRSRQSDREHSFELMLTDGSCLQLSAASDEEAREWLQCLCQAVSEGVGVSSPGSGSIACCCLVTETKLLTFHEDTHTSFFRTLGSTNIVDVTNILIDHDNDTLTVIVFEPVDSSRSTDQWVLYFNSRFERDKFVCSLCQVWGSHYQVALPVNEIDDSKLRARYQETRQIISDRLKP